MWDESRVDEILSENRAQQLCRTCHRNWSRQRMTIWEPRNKLMTSLSSYFAFSELTQVAYSAKHERKLFLVLGTVILFFVSAASARAQDRGAVGLAAAPADQGIQKLPVIDRQDIRFVHLSIGGQPFNKRVLAINQDNYGFMWLGTDEGLYRYDGYSLRSYQHNPNNPRTLSDNVAQVIYKDRSGTLWIGTGYGGLDRFDPALDAFTHYRHDPNDSRSLRNDQVWCIYQDRAGSLWIGTTDGLDRLDLATGSFTHYSHPVGDNAGGHAIRAIYEDGQGSFLFGGADGRLYTLDPSGARLSRFPNRAIESSRHDHGYIIRDFKQDRAGTLWASSLFENEVTALNTKTEELRRYSYNWKLPAESRSVADNQDS